VVVFRSGAAVDRPAAEAYLEVQVWAGGGAGGPDQADDLPRADLFARCDQDPLLVAVAG
jgi:hypothetical protein